MFYLGLVTMKEMSPKQWAKAAGTSSPAGHTKNLAADSVLTVKSDQSVHNQSFAFLGLPVTAVGFSLSRLDWSLNHGACLSSLTLKLTLSLLSYSCPFLEIQKP